MRVRHGLSLAGLGRLVHVSGDLLGKIEKADRRAQSDLVDRLDHALGAGGVLRLLGTDLCARPASRQVRADLTLPPDASLEILRGIVDAARDGDHAMEAGDYLGSLLAHAHAAELAASRIGRQPELRRIICETYQLAGWMSFDAGHPCAAGKLFAKARAWAELASDPSLIAFLLGPNLSFAATYGGQPALGVERAYAALGWSRRGGNRRLTAFIMAIGARAHARLGEATLCFDLLDHAYRELDRHLPYQEDPGWLTVFDRAALDGHRGSCLLDLGQPRDALEPLTDQSLAADGRFVRNRVIWLLDRTDAHLRLRMIDEACEDLTAAMSRAGSGSVTRRVLRHFQTIDIQLREHATIAPVDDARARLREFIVAHV